MKGAVVRGIHVPADGGCRRPRAIHSVKWVTLNKCDNIINNRARRICAYVIHPQRCHYFQRSLLQPLTLQARIEDPIHTYIHTYIDRSIDRSWPRTASTVVRGLIPLLWWTTTTL